MKQRDEPQQSGSSSLCFIMERVVGVGPASSPWKGDIIPLYDTRKSYVSRYIKKPNYWELLSFTLVQLTLEADSYLIDIVISFFLDAPIPSFFGFARLVCHTSCGSGRFNIDCRSYTNHANSGSDAKPHFGIGFHIRFSYGYSHFYSSDGGSHWSSTYNCRVIYWLARLLCSHG